MRICFVCLGNICRSPTAEAIMADLVEKAGCSAEVTVASAGTAAWHVGETPDPRSAAEVERRGLTMRSRARRFEAWDFDDFDLVVAMDEQNSADLMDLAFDEASAAKVRLLREFDPTAEPGDPLDVPDPYHGGPDGFVHVFDMIESACRGLLDEVRSQ